MHGGRAKRMMIDSSGINGAKNGSAWASGVPVAVVVTFVLDSLPGIAWKTLCKSSRSIHRHPLPSIRPLLLAPRVLLARSSTRGGPPGRFTFAFYAFTNFSRRDDPLRVLP